MIILISIIGVLAGLITIASILIQEPRSHGIGTIFGIPTHLLGIKQTLILIEKITIWAIVFFTLAIMVLSKRDYYVKQVSTVIEEIVQTAPPVINIPQAQQQQGK